MDLKPQFDTFLSDIRLTENQVKELRDAHWLLRERLRGHASVQDIVVSDFLQGSYRRKTATRPKNGNRADVDIIVVTTLAESDYTPQEAMDEFVPFLDEYYADKWDFQGRSIGIAMSDVSLDIVVTSAPSEAMEKALRSDSVLSEAALDAQDWAPSLDWVPLEKRAGSLVLAKRLPQWKLEPLRIPDRDAAQWDDTHPLEQIRFAWDKNRITGGHYVNVVKAIKWWRRVYPEPKYPKGYPVEHLIGLYCPDNISSVAEGVTRALEEIAGRHRIDVILGRVPYVADHGVPGHNVLHRLTPSDFAEFHAKVTEAAGIARQALDSNDRDTSTQLWQKLFGSRFPDPPSRGRGGAGNGGGGGDGGGYTPRGGPTTVPTSGERWG
jgi:hypothetical protein